MLDLWLLIVGCFVGCRITDCLRVCYVNVCYLGFCV